VLLLPQPQPLSQLATSQPQAGSQVLQAVSQVLQAVSQPQAGSQVLQGASQQLLFFFMPPNNLSSKQVLFFDEQPLSHEATSQAISQPQAGSQADPQAGPQAVSQPQAGSQAISQAVSQPQAGSQAGPQAVSHPHAGSQAVSQAGVSQQELLLPHPFSPNIRSNRSNPKLCEQIELPSTRVATRSVRFMEIFSSTLKRVSVQCSVFTTIVRPVD